jgi:hypothetical protein
MLLAYGFLLATPAGVSPDALNHRIESWFLQTHDCDLVFECPDALDKLVRFGLVRMLPDGHVVPLGLAEALAKLDAVWDGYFRFPHGFTDSNDHSTALPRES